MADVAPSPKDKFTFGLWTVGHTGRDPFGAPTRPALSPAETVDLLGEVGGVHGVNLHDNDLVPIDASPKDAEALKDDFQKALKRTKLRVAMASANLFADPVFKDGAFTSNDAEVRAYAVQKTMRGLDLAAELGAKVFVFWGGREGVETDASKDPVEAWQRYKTAIDFLCEYTRDRGYEFQFALEAKPNEPRGTLYFGSTGYFLAMIPTLKHAAMVGVNPEVAHERMAGGSAVHAVAAALACGKLYHIDLNDQAIGRFDQDARFGSIDLKEAFFLVKLLEDHRYDGFRHFDAHAYRSSDRGDVIEFARGCMRTYLLLRERVKAWSGDSKVRALLKQAQKAGRDLDTLWGYYSKGRAETLLGMHFDREALARRSPPYEALDQRTMEILLGLE
jgi:xylose isomerase